MKFGKLARIILPITLSLAIAGCSTLERMALNSPMGKMAVSQVENFGNSFKEKYNIVDYNHLLNQEDSSKDKQIILYIHGWSGLEKDIYEKKDGKASSLDVMNEVFENRVLFANYPSNHKVEDIFSGIENPFLDFVSSYYAINEVEPNLTVVGHSQGAELARMFARKYSQNVRKVGLIAGVNNGVDLWFRDFFREALPRQMKEILIENNMPSSEDNYENIKQLMTGSPLFAELNTLTEPLNVEYNIYALVSNGMGNPFIKWRDDTVAGFDSAYPRRLISENKFENVNIGDAVIISGKRANHFAVDDSEIFRKILVSLKSDKKKYLKNLPRPEDAEQWIFN
jgi:pimeloyl-ACP methyl ester carboxylesterase